MTMTYVFLGLTDPALPTRFARVEVRLDWGEGAKAIRALSAAIGPDGVARFDLLGGAFEIRPRPAPAGKAAKGARQDLAQLTVASAPSPVSPM
jgi:hypothetical protein